MPRARQGSAFVKRGRLTIQVRLRPGAPRRFWLRECPADMTLLQARAAAEDFQRKYDAGTWDPLATKPDATAAQPAAPQDVRTFVDGWARAQTYESAPKDRKVLAKYLADDPIGGMPVASLRPKHLADFVGRLSAAPSPRGGALAARSVRNVYDALRRALDAAVVAELLPANPCAVLRRVLPEVVDKDPEARDGWFFPRGEVWSLMTDARVNAARRVVYALEFLTGCRPGEFAVLRWRDWDRAVEPLTRLTITRAMKSVSRKVGRTKTGARKPVPVHPFLASVLADWRAEGWRAFMGRDPQPDDLIVPNQDGAPRNTNRANRDFKRDLAKLELRERHHYCTRHTFITQVQDDGADRDIIKWVTHAPPKSAHDGYTRTLWTRLCAELAKLRVGPAQGLTPRSTPGGGGGEAAESQNPRELAASEGLGFLSGREDLNKVTGSPFVQYPSQSAEFSEDAGEGTRPFEARNGRLTPRSTPPGVDGPHAGEGALYAWADRALLADPMGDA